MSNAYSLLSTGNTFGDWIVTTNALVKENNDFHANNYHKNAGTLYLDDSSLGLQVNNQAIFAGTFQVTGTGSSATIQNNLTVQTGQVYLQNTQLTLVASGLIQANGTNTGLYVANNANIRGVLNVTGNTFLGNNLNVVYNTTTSNSITSIDSYVGRNLNVVEKTFTDVLQANTSANTRLLTVTGSAYVNILQANSSVNTSQLTVSNNVTTSNVVATGSVYVTTNINAANIVSTNVTASGNIFSSNSFVTSNITTSNVVATGSVYVTNNVTTGNLVATGSVYLSGNVTTSSVVATGNVWVTSNVQAANVVASRLYVSGPTQLVGTANTTDDLGIGGNLNVPNVLFMGNSTSSANIYALTVGQSVGNGGLTVQGNFTIASPTIYQAPSFTLYGGTAITGGNFAYFNVNRLPGTNASIRWNETNKEWGVANVISGSVYRILTDEYSSSSSSSANSMTYPTSYALANANTFLQTLDSTSNTAMKAYVDQANTGLKSYGDATYFAKTGGTISGAVTISSGGLISTASPIGITSGGTNNNTYTTGQVLQYNGSSFASLANVTAFSATGSSTAIPIITTDSYGRVTALTTASISTTLSISGNTGTGSVALASQTLKVTSSTNTVTSIVASGNTITIADMPSGVTATSYGSSTAIPVLAIDTYGRITSATTAGVSTTISLAGGSGSGSVAGGGTLTLNGSTGLTTSVSGSTYTLTNSGVTSFSTSLTGLTPSTSSTGAITLAGTLGVASGGTGVTTSTGTGNNVLSNSPTLVTPALGTPSSGNLANCTFPTLNQNTTGTAAGLSATLAVASGGTGVTSSTGTGNNVLSASPTFSGTVSGITKSMVGLGSVDNTADASKSVSFATTAGSATTATTATTANALNTSNNYQVNSFGVGTSATGTAGEIRATNNITAYYSDDRLKTRSGNIQNALAKVMTLNGFHYQANEVAQALGYVAKPEVGVSAQEVQAIMPEVVVPAPIDEQYLTVHYDKLVPLLIEAIKELKAEIDTLKGSK
jgi:hypothetical protein